MFTQVKRRTDTDYTKLSTDKLIHLYESAASQHGLAKSEGEFVSGNPAADVVAAIYHEIRSRGIEHQKKLLALLLSDDIGVRGWAAAHALEFEPSRSEAILTEMSRGTDNQAFSAKMTLKVWREGNLRFP